MQTKEQARNWKVVASVATVAALGVGGLAVASPNSQAGSPPPIELDDTRSANVTSQLSGNESNFQIVPSPTIDPGDSLDSPLASADITETTQATVATTAADDSPDDADSPMATDSHETSDSPADPPPPVDDASPDDSPADSVDSTGSVDSLDS